LKQTLIFLTLLVFQTVDGQNIVPNSSFEDVNICTEIHQPCSPSGWFYINHLVTGYINRGGIKPINGDKYLNLLVVDTGSFHRDYWQTMLLCPLEMGKEYKVSLKLAAEYIGPNLNDIGLYFTDSLYFFSKDTVIQPFNYINFLDARIKKLKNGWYEVQKEFTATSANQFLIIGNFSGKTNKEITTKREISIKGIYLSVDDLIIISKNGIFCQDAEKVKDSMYSIKDRHSKAQFHDPPVLEDKIIAKTKIDTIILNNIEFDFDSYQIKNPSSLQYLHNYLLDTTIKKITITGFTDNTGSMQYNRSLSENRAKAVAHFLIEEFGLKESGIEVEGKGISTKYAGAQQNRRVEIYIYH